MAPCTAGRDLTLAGYGKQAINASDFDAIWCAILLAARQDIWAKKDRISCTQSLLNFTVKTNVRAADTHFGDFRVVLLVCRHTSPCLPLCT